MFHKTRKQQRKEFELNFICKELADYLSAFNKHIPTEEEIDEIVSFVTTLDNPVHPCKKNYIANPDTCTIITRVLKYTKKECDISKRKHLMTIYIKYFKEIILKMDTMNLSRLDTIGWYLLVLSAEAMKREFQSLLAYIRFIKLTLIEEDGCFHIVSVHKQKEAKLWVNTQHNLMMNWNICIKQTIEEPDHGTEAS